MSWAYESHVASVEVLVTMSDGSAHSLTTTDASIIRSCSFNFEREYLEPWMPFEAAPPPIVEMTVAVDGHDIRIIQQHHPAPKEPDDV